MNQLVPLSRLSATFPAFFRHREVAGRHLLTNYEGGFVLLDAQEFGAFSRGEVPRESTLYRRLAERNFVREAYDVRRAAEKLKVRKRFLDAGPNLHIMVVTLRCNETCVYCHASRADMTSTATDMTPELAERTVDLILQTSSPGVTIEFQGGEPLANFGVVKHAIEYALKRNEVHRKVLDFTMVTNLSLMDDEKLAWLLEKKVQLCTSVDGPEHLHDKQRKLPGLSAFKAASGWIKRINDAYAAMGLDPRVYHVEALLTTTRETLPRWKEVVDTYVDLGCKAIFLRPVDPFGFAEKTHGRIEYPRAEYLEFYRSAVDYMLALDQQGVEILERFASIFLTKILGGEDPNFLDIRNPCGAGIGQIAYNYDGRIFTCDEGRMVHEMGDSTFAIGQVGTTSYAELMTHPTVRTLTLASNLDQQPDCVNCAYNPYCGVCPVHNHRSQGTLQGRMRESSLCQVHKGIQDYLFEKLGAGDPAVLRTFERWITTRDRAHFIQMCS